MPQTGFRKKKQQPDPGTTCTTIEPGTEGVIVGSLGGDLADVCVGFRNTIWGVARPNVVIYEKNSTGKNTDTKQMTKVSGRHRRKGRRGKNEATVAAVKNENSKPTTGVGGDHFLRGGRVNGVAGKKKIEKNKGA